MATGEEPSECEWCDVAVVGAGVSGLQAAQTVLRILRDTWQRNGGGAQGVPGANQAREGCNRPGVAGNDQGEEKGAGSRVPRVPRVPRVVVVEASDWIGGRVRSLHGLAAGPIEASLSGVRTAGT